MNIDEAYNGIKHTLTDLANAQYVFQTAFESNNNIGHDIKTILELGVFKIPNSDLPGQSTKILLILSHFFPTVNKYISVDIDDCAITIDRSQKFIRDLGMNITNHKFIISSTLDFDVSAEFDNKVDLIFLDTSHDDDYPRRIGFGSEHGEAGTTYKELNIYTKHLSRNGHLFLHDTKMHYVAEQYGWNVDGGVRRFLDENDDFTFIEHNPNEHGLGEIIYKDSEIANEYLNRGIEFTRP